MVGALVTDDVLWLERDVGRGRGDAGVKVVAPEVLKPMTFIGSVFVVGSTLDCMKCWQSLPVIHLL